VTVDSQLGDDTIAVRARSRQPGLRASGRIRDNAFYERPATMALVGNVAGLRGDRADLVLADLAAPLPFATAGFDIVVASLVLRPERCILCLARSGESRDVGHSLGHTAKEPF
jgi:hypothetical protein